MKAYVPKQLYLNKELHAGKALLVDGSHIHDICAAKHLPADADRITLDGILVPGYIDLQINGCGGAMFSQDLSVNSVKVMSDTNLSHGVTSFLPTLVTARDEDISAAFEVVEQARSDISGVIGMHLEGPYISAEKPGIHRKNLIRPLDSEGVQRVCNAAKRGILKLLTVAPESVTTGQIRILADTGLTVSLGHTAATAEEILAAEDSGAKMLTHIFNAMPPMLGRDPGPVGAALFSDRLLASIIVDHAHVSDIGVRAIYEGVGDRLLLVSDASASIESSGDTFALSGHVCRIEDGVVRNEEGGLAGAAMLLDRCVMNTAEMLGDVAQAIFMATELPAQAIGMEQDIGSLSPAAMADFNLLDSESLQVVNVWKQGEIFEKNNSC